MYDVAHKAPGCVADPPYDSTMCGFRDVPGCKPLNGCGRFSVFPFLIIFNVIIVFVCLNLFVGVVVSEFNYVNNAIVSTDQLTQFAKLWSVLDPKATYYLNVEDLETFVAGLFAPLGFSGRKYTKRQLMQKIGKYA